jgi:hypothetical protein
MKYSTWQFKCGDTTVTDTSSKGRKERRGNQDVYSHLALEKVKVQIYEKEETKFPEVKMPRKSLRLNTGKEGKIKRGEYRNYLSVFRFTNDLYKTKSHNCRDTLVRSRET